MGKCCSKPSKEEENAIPLNKFPQNSKEGLGEMESGDIGTDSKFKSSADDRKNESIENNSFEDTFRENAILLKSAKGDQSGNKKLISTKNDFVIGKYFDEEQDLWFRSIYVLETDSIRKQFLSINSLDMRKVDKNQFEDWCDTNGYPDTKIYYDSFKLLDYMPLNRMLSGLSHKYEVKIYISDLFIYKGKGPYRAITCYGRQSSLIDRALNEYETRLGKGVTIPHLTKHWDNFIFPDPSVDIADHSLDIPFKWPRRNKPEPPFVPHYPYKPNKSCPQRLKKIIDEMSLELKKKVSTNSENLSKKVA